MDEHSCDILIFGGGIAGLWLLDEARRAGHACVLVEADALGSGQSIASQGIIHGGLKYTLDGLFSASADAIRDMPGIWRTCLRGEREPDLRRAAVRAEYCHLWRTGGIASRLGMIGARVGLRVAPQRVEDSERPAALRACPGDVFRLDEQVLDTGSVLAALATRNRDSLLRIASRNAALVTAEAGDAPVYELLDADSGGAIRIRAGVVVFAAGAGNAALRDAAGLAGPAMQRRPLHMVMLRGALPALNGHCAEGSRTRITVTTIAGAGGRTVWQVGGQLAEDGVSMARDGLIAHAKREIAACIPEIELSGAEWSTYRVDRAEPAMDGGKRPSSAFAQREGNFITAWPTKLALAPQLAKDVLRLAGSPGARTSAIPALDSWPRPTVGAPPWEEESKWAR